MLTTLLWFGGIILLVGILWLAGSALALQRQRLLRSLSKKLNLTPPRADDSLLESLRGFDMIRVPKGNRWISNVMTGTLNLRPLIAFDYLFQVFKPEDVTPKDGRVHFTVPGTFSTTVFCVTCPCNAKAHLRLWPKNRGKDHKYWQDVFKGDAAKILGTISDTFHLRTGAGTVSALNFRLQNWLLESSEKDVFLELRHDAFLIHFGRQIPVNEFEKYLEKVSVACSIFTEESEGGSETQADAPLSGI